MPRRIGPLLALFAILAACGRGHSSGSCPGYDHARKSGRCGGDRWSVKIASDPDASRISRTPVVTTIAALYAMKRPATLPEAGRAGPVELTTYELRNVSLELARLEFDNDYHLAVNDGSRAMIVELPFPECVAGSSPFVAEIACTRGRVDDRLDIVHATQRPNLEVTVVGVGFFDELHESFGAPNGIELHPIVAICFGHDCDPRR